MLWKTHLRISIEVLRLLRIYLAPEVYQSFKNGIVSPDQWGDYPHHYGKSESIKQYLLKSRAYFLQDDLPNTFFNLGVALHYIQDSYTSVESYNNNGRGREIHQNWERYIDESREVDDNELLNAINYSLRDNDFQRDRCLSIANSLSKSVVGRDNTLYMATLSGQWKSTNSAKPIVDYNLGRRASYVVAESVLSSKSCPELEGKLRDGLSNCEVLLRTAEVDLSSKIVRLISERDELRIRRVPSSGLVSKIKNWVLGVRAWLKERAANSNYNNYAARGHLDNVVRDYLYYANGAVAPYMGWYNFQIPRINPSSVSKQLLSIQEVSKVLNENEQALKGSFYRLNMPLRYVGSWELVTRSDLNRLLNNFPVNGFSQYPA